MTSTPPAVRSFYNQVNPDPYYALPGLNADPEYDLDAWGPVVPLVGLASPPTAAPASGGLGTTNFAMAYASNGDLNRGIPPADMDAFRDFVFAMHYPPNPERPATRVYSGIARPPSTEAQLGLELFFVNTTERCVACRAMPFGTNQVCTEASGNPLDPTRASGFIETAALRGLFFEEKRLVRQTFPGGVATLGAVGSAPNPISMFGGPAFGAVTREFGLPHAGMTTDIASPTTAFASETTQHFTNGFGMPAANRDALSLFQRQLDTGISPGIGIPLLADRLPQDPDVQTAVAPPAQGGVWQPPTTTPTTASHEWFELPIYAEPSGGTNVWETSVEVDPTGVYALMVGGPNSPGDLYFGGFATYQLAQHRADPANPGWANAFFYNTPFLTNAVNNNPGATIQTAATNQWASDLPNLVVPNWNTLGPERWNWYYVEIVSTFVPSGGGAAQTVVSNGGWQRITL